MLFFYFIIAFFAISSCITHPLHTKLEWEKGVVVVTMYDEIDDDLIEEFLKSYVMFDLRYLRHNKNTMRLSFNDRIINEHRFVKKLNKDQRVEHASLNYYIHATAAGA